MNTVWSVPFDKLIEDTMHSITDSTFYAEKIKPGLLRSTIQSCIVTVLLKTGVALLW